ncbi:alpha/beta hydrolase-fold protein [Lutibacter sp. TH_r2]|uniref:alpha/beta hydrolase-fold protein n=1 Tax=Lutibacter sp. TH_r2 TaxID=3082083 RepID=UPI0029540B49|nr:alpha/beta hydrolase-fold protein [Lutibacter sp. TH_r2]MDV7187649.1 alpha/beta hydrolase-fold protein [Lutibacter sp. TH_r2]
MTKRFIIAVFSLIVLFTAQKIQAQINTDTKSDSIYSNTFNEFKNIWVKLPDNYNPASSEKYPVVFILDGSVQLNTLETVYNNYWGHYLPHMILVGISNQTNRTRDLTTSQIKMRRGTEMDEDTGGAEKFTEYITKELIPHIDKNYPTTSYRTLIGHSYAGLFTVNMLINHKEFFKNYIAIDPSLDWDNQKLLKQAKEKLASEDFKGKSLFVSMSAEQLHMMDESVTIDNLMENTSEFTLFPRSIMEFSNFAESHKESGLNFSFKIYPEDLHGTVPLPSIRDGLVFLFNWFQFKNPPTYNNPETTVAELTELLNIQAKIYAENFGYNVPPMVEELFNGYGYMNMQMGAPEKAKLFFEMGVKYYPNSANVYDSLAEYYESVEDFSNALKYIKKAFEISGSLTHKKRLEEIQAKN